MRRAHVRGEEPQPNVEEPFPQGTNVRKPVIIKKIETRSPLHELYLDSQNQTDNNDPREPIPSPTMPPLEDTEARSECEEIDTTEILLPVEIRAKIIRNFLRPDQHTVAPPRVVESSTNTPNWQNSDKIDSPPKTTDMGSHSNIAKPDIKICDTMSRLRTRSKLRKLASRRQQASNNNNREHSLLDQNIVTPTNAVPEAYPMEPAQNNANNNITNQGACGGATTKKPTPKQKQPDGSDPSSTITVPRQRRMIKNSQRRKIRGDLITIYKLEDEIEYVEDPVDIWVLQQHRAGNRDPRFTSASRAERRRMMENGMWPLNGTGKIPPQPTSADGNDNIGRTP